MKTTSVLVTVLATVLAAGQALAGGGPAAAGGMNAPAGNVVIGAPVRIIPAPVAAAGDAATREATAQFDGTIRLIDQQGRRLMLENGKTYTFADNVPMPVVNAGEKVLLTLDTTKPDVIISISTTK